MACLLAYYPACLGWPGLGQQAVGYWIQLPAMLLCTKVGALGLLESYLPIQNWVYWNLINRYKNVLLAFSSQKLVN